MKEKVNAILDNLIQAYSELESCKQSIFEIYNIIEQAYKNGGMLFVCGNGGSAADSEHIVGELMKSFKIKRTIKGDTARRFAEYGDEGVLLSYGLENALPAISLTSHISLSTAFANDNNPALVFAQQLYGLGKKNDVLLTISTSGNSKNCVYAAVTAKVLGIKVVSLTGANESKLSNISDATVRVPQIETYKVQELHLPVYHCICAILEEEFFAQ